MPTNKSAPYRGRFAPSPTGQLHFGSLVAAVASFLDARSHQGQWMLRMEDIDQTREVIGSAQAILQSLETFGFEWDGEIVYQSQQLEAYENALEQLHNKGLTFACNCTRKKLAETATLGAEGPVYPGTCRHQTGMPDYDHAIRFQVPNQQYSVRDRIQGELTQNLAKDIGDFVIRRTDGFFAYQLAVVVDDANQGITHVVRGADLFLSTPRQIYLQTELDLNQPEYAHIPLAVDDSGRKLSKRSQTDPVDEQSPVLGLMRALAYLNQTLPPDLPVNKEEFWQWAIAHWNIRDIPSLRSKADVGQQTQPPSPLI